jgi:hypothetical protein
MPAAADQALFRLQQPAPPLLRGVHKATALMQPTTVEISEIL